MSANEEGPAKALLPDGRLDFNGLSNGCVISCWM